MATYDEEKEKLKEVTSQAYLDVEKEFNEKSTKDFFVEIVNEKISEGWVLQGSVSVYSYETGNAQYGYTVHMGYCQAVKK